MNKLFLISILFISSNTLGQNNELQFIHKDSFQLAIPNIDVSEYKTHIRIHINGQTVDLYCNKDSVFKGILTNEICEYHYIKTKKEKHREIKRIVYQKIELDSVLTSIVAKQLFNTRQDTIPTDSAIDSWGNIFFHCDRIKFEYWINGLYKKQIFHCPWGQSKTTPLVDIIISNYNLITDKLQLKKKYDEFTSHLEGGKTYSKDGYMLLTIMSVKQSEWYEKDKPRRDYLKSIKDTIDNYLSSEIGRLSAQSNIECSFYFNLIFNKKGKLKSIKIPDYQKPKLFDDLEFYIEDIREIRKCKKLIKQMFKKIDLSSFNLKYKVNRTLEFHNGYIQVRDNMMC